MHLLASVMVVEGSTLWSRDRRLAEAAAGLSVLWEPPTDPDPQVGDVPAVGP